MTAKFLLRLLVVGGALAISGAVTAADLAHYRGMCRSAAYSALADQPSPVIKQTLQTNFEDAKAGMDEPRVIASTSPALVWAMQARWACSAAIGYLDGGHLDLESVQKCDCFHQRYVSFR